MASYTVERSTADKLTGLVPQPQASRLGKTDQLPRRVHGPATSRRITVLDLAGLIVGYATAASIYRSTVLAQHPFSELALSVVAAIAFAWLGLVLSGPIVLGLRSLQRTAESRRSGPESIWGILGLLWYAVAVARWLRFLDPDSLTNLASFLAAAAAAVAPLFFVIHWRSERKRMIAADRSTWCHHAGLLCAAAWPAGWCLAAFLLGI